MGSWSNVKIFQKNSLFHPEMILRPVFCFKDTKNTALLIFNSLKQKKLIFNFVVNRNWKKLTDSRKRAKILADNRKSHHPIETLYPPFPNLTSHWWWDETFTDLFGTNPLLYARNIHGICLYVYA